MYAVNKHSSSTIFKLLIENGADFNIGAPLPSLFHLAAEADNVFAIVYLV
jgi:hypothetical protein